MSDAEARKLAHDQKAIIHIDGGLHATEVANAQHTIQLGYDLVASEEPEYKKIREDVITELWFSINPDGQTMVANWYRQNVGTPYEVAPLPYLWQEYVGHDNNRDGYMLNMIESQVVTKATLETQPLVFYTHHQTAPFPGRIYLPPFADPISEQHASADAALAEPDRHDHRVLSRRARHARVDASGNVRRLVSRVSG